jgi:hypothetical protein
MAQVNRGETATTLKHDFGGENVLVVFATQGAVTSELFGWPSISKTNEKVIQIRELFHRSVHLLTHELVNEI